ncbi:hypothetical protein MVEG_04225 [Podila verticillata NRRL 6337]|nr:hypothetical protein MVEG_04225 [Podila verticillata NRRL 6337]
MTPLPFLYTFLSLALVLISLSSALPVERRRNPLASIILGSDHNNGRSGINVGLGLHRPGLILGRSNEPDIETNKASDSSREYHTLPWHPQAQKKRSLPEEEAVVVSKREAEAQGYRPGGPGSGGQYDKGQPYGR